MSKLKQMDQTLLVDADKVLEKYPGKGGWVYTYIDEIKPDKRTKFGWVQVSGFIDDFELKRYKLMPAGEGRLFLPVRAEIRKKINKQEGDTIHIRLYLDHSPIEIPDEFLLCLSDDFEAKAFFHRLTESEQMHYLDWIYKAKREETKINRLAKTINRLAKGLKMYDQEVK